MPELRLRQLILALAAACCFIFACNTAIFAGQKAKTGTIKMSYKGKSTLLMLEKLGGKRLTLNTRNGILAVPPKAYVLELYRSIAKGKDGTEWEATRLFYAESTGPDGKIKPHDITVNPGATYNLQVGPPFTAYVAIQESGKDQVKLDLKVTGVGGGNYEIIPARKRPKPPIGFQVLDSSGKVVWKGSFTYG